ncbi:hypothetical protein RRF57_003544 [Xylaria bambusicola]|uniref:Apple domain-containing protein n=1 Tax=Xylaria bambusicola TaxID=326684 RepID=A0AAN7UUJ6_9PEZI
MLRNLLLVAATFGGLVSAETMTFVISTTDISCTTQFGSGGVAPTPIPTRKTLTTITTTVTDSTKTVPAVAYVTAATVTVTDHTSTYYTWGIDTVTVPTFTSSGGRLVLTVATGTFALTACSGEARPTVTVYSGTYTPVSGQNTVLPSTYPTQASCRTGVTWSFLLEPTVTSGTVTSTVTATSTVTSPTTTSTSTILLATRFTYLTTVTVTETTYTPHAVVTTTTVACPEETVTKTLAAQCAPTNLIGAINGEGLQSGRYADRISVIYTRNDPWGTDASLCCQACLDNEGCGAAMSISGACGLYYTATVDAEPVCDAFIFSFTSTPRVWPGQGLVVSNGCDRVEFSHSNP